MPGARVIERTQKLRDIGASVRYDRPARQIGDGEGTAGSEENLRHRSTGRLHALDVPAMMLFELTPSPRLQEIPLCPMEQKIPSHLAAVRVVVHCRTDSFPDVQHPRHVNHR